MLTILPLMEAAPEIPVPQDALQKVVTWAILAFVVTGIGVGTVAFWVWAYKKLFGSKKKGKGLSLEVAEDGEEDQDSGNGMSVGRVFAAYEEQYKRTIAGMERQHQERITAMEKQFNDRLDDMERSHTARISAMEITHADRVKVLEGIISSGKRELDALRVEKDREIEAQRKRCHDLVNKTQELSTDVSVLETKIEIAKKQSIPHGLTHDEVIQIFEHSDPSGTAFGQILEAAVEKNLRKLQGNKA